MKRLLDRIIPPEDRMAMDFCWQIAYKPILLGLITVGLAIAFLGSYAYFAYYFFTTSPC